MYSREHYACEDCTGIAVRYRHGHIGRRPAQPSLDRNNSFDRSDRYHVSTHDDFTISTISRAFLNQRPLGPEHKALDMLLADRRAAENEEAAVKPG